MIIIVIRAEPSFIIFRFSLWRQRWFVSNRRQGVVIAAKIVLRDYAQPRTAMVPFFSFLLFLLCLVNVLSLWSLWVSVGCKLTRRTSSDWRGVWGSRWRGCWRYRQRWYPYVLLAGHDERYKISQNTGWSGVSPNNNHCWPIYSITSQFIFIQTGISSNRYQ